MTNSGHKKFNNSLVWFRQDLRLTDNYALSEAIKSSNSILPIYIFSEELPSFGGASAWWLHHSLKSLEQSLIERGARLVILKGNPIEEIKKIIKLENIEAVFWNRLYEPSFIKRDKKIKEQLGKSSITVKSYNSSMLIEPWNILNSSSKPFQVFTPFWKKLNSQYQPAKLPVIPKKFRPLSFSGERILIEDLELLPKIPWDKEFYNCWEPGEKAAQRLLKKFLNSKVEDYKEERDFPAILATSKLSPHLHFGEISPRQIWAAAEKSSENVEPYLRQIAWREFAQNLLFHFPKSTTKPLREKFKKFPWKKNSKFLRAWQQGKTGYPIVDAGMRELWVTGWMHNRVRMIVGSFLVKHLLQPWQEGAQWFWDTLVDADQANNTMGWQWISGCGADAAPYFRVFNPILQGERFDTEGAYVRKWIPALENLPKQYVHKPWEAPKNVLELAGLELGKNYPHPIVSHQDARNAALEAYESLN